MDLAALLGAMLGLAIASIIDMFWAGVLMVLGWSAPTDKQLAGMLLIGPAVGVVAMVVVAIIIDRTDSAKSGLGGRRPPR